jgi:hypothetical protein
MPADFYPGDYGRIILKLDAAYASDLAPSSKINVRVNGASVSTIPLQKRGGDTLSKRAAYLPLSAFKPGVNVVDIETETLTASDAKCSPALQMQPRDRFLLAQTSEIEVPSLARIATFPSLSGVIAGSLHAASGREPMRIFLPRPGPEAIEASLRLVAKIAAVSGRVAPVSFDFERPAEGAAHILTIGALSDVPSATLIAAGLDPDVLQRAWRDVPRDELDLQASAIPVRVPTAPVQVAGLNGSWMPQEHPLASLANKTSELPIASTKEGLLGASLETGEGRLTVPNEGEGLLGRTREWVETAAAMLKEVIPIDVGPQGLSGDLQSGAAVVSKGHTLVVAQGASSGELSANWQLLPEITSSTVFVAPTPELLQASISDLLNSGAWQQLAGGASGFDRSEAALRSQGATAQFFVPTQSLTPGNVRLILAGWMSHNVVVYLGVLAGVIVLLTGLTYSLVRSSGVRA